MSKKTVLIVEDEAIVAADLAAKLGQLGYEVVGTVATGEDAVESAVRLQPRVVLMDIRLKGPMDGIEAAEAIRGRIDVPVIYLTAHSDAATLERAKLSEPFGYILKPFEERELTTNLEMALHRHDSDSEKRHSQEATRKALHELELRTAELQTASESLRSSRVAALNLMEDAVLARNKAEETSVELRKEIAERKRAEESLLRLNKALKALSDISQAVIRAQDEPEYLNDVCRIVVEDCGYSMTWIGFAENDEQKSVRPVAYSGFDEGYLETLHITWADTEQGRGPTGTAIRTGKVAACRNMQTDPAFAPWRDEAIKRGYSSSIVFPLRTDDRVFGAISMYSAEPDPFTVDEVRLLTELTDNVAYGIEVLRVRAAREQAEEALTASESKYRSLFENMIDGLAYHRIVTDENGKPVDYVFLEVNEAFEKQTGLKRADIIGKSVREALPGIENDPADWIGTYGKVALTGQEARFQHYAAPLGKWYSVSAYSPVKGYFVAIFEDVTESKKAEGALRESEERFRSMFERHQAVMLLVEPESGAIVDANAAASRFYEYSREQLVAMRVQDINQLKPGDVAAERRAAAEEKRNYFVFPHRLADGRVRSVEVYSTPVEAQGRPLLFSIIHDITERKQAEAELLKLSENMAARNMELESANQEMESFVYSISHDLRAPIRTMSGFAKIIVEDYLDKLDAQGRDYLNRILKGSDKSTQLIENLLHLSKISRQDMDRIEVDLSGKASKVMEELREMNRSRSVEVVVQEGLAASADPRLIELALSNLLGNAWKFTAKTEQARIEFGSIEKDGKTVYYVKDNGAGFDPAYADKMFWPFHRLHSENEFEGTGIGLAIVERVVRRHGGRVWAEGEVGKGATVYFTLG